MGVGALFIHFLPNTEISIEKCQWAIYLHRYDATGKKDLQYQHPGRAAFRTES